jgi:FMN reductase
VLDLLVRADGLIAVTPTYAGSFSGLFKSFVDVLDDEARVDKPVLVGATGGTARHSLVLEHAIRPLFTYLRAVVVPTSVFAAPEDWAGASAPDLLAGRIARAAGQLAAEIDRRDRRPSEIRSQTRRRSTGYSTPAQRRNTTRPDTVDPLLSKTRSGTGVTW